MNIEIKVTKLTATKAIVRFSSSDGLHYVLPYEALYRLAIAAIARKQDDVIGNADTSWMVDKTPFSNGARAVYLSK